MIKTRKRLTICVTLLVLNLAFIWGNSLMPGEVSGALSQWVKDFLARIFPMGSQDSNAGHGLLRKLAHFTEFCCLGACLSWLFAMLRKRLWLPLVSGFLAACVDETIQRFVPDRGPSFKDVCIDTAGVVLGVALLLVGCAIYQKQNNQCLEEKQL